MTTRRRIRRNRTAGAAVAVAASAALAVTSVVAPPSAVADTAPPSGTPARIAPPVYEVDGTRDLAGSLPRGGSTSADYAFALPGSSLPVVLVVDLDETHAPAVFTGTSR